MTGRHISILLSLGSVALLFLVLSTLHRNLSPSSDLGHNEISQLTPEETRLRDQKIVKARENQLLHTIRDLKHVMKRQIQKIGTTEPEAKGNAEKLKNDLELIDHAMSKLRNIDHVRDKIV